MSKKKYSGSVGGKGYYIALALCATAIGIAGLLYYRNAEDPNVSLEDPTATIAGSNHQAVVATGPNGLSPLPTSLQILPILPLLRVPTTTLAYNSLLSAYISTHGRISSTVPYALLALPNGIVSMPNIA